MDNTSSKNKQEYSTKVKTAGQIPRKHMKAHRHIYDDNHTCILCGSQHISSGKIFKGFCVCEECVEYVCADSDNKSA